jgi:hypothetical protein
MDASPLFTAIEKTIQVADGLVVLENHNGFPFSESNLYLIDTRGEIAWKAEKPEARALFSKIKLNEDRTLSTFTTHGYLCEIDLNTGKIISQSKL